MEEFQNLEERAEQVFQDRDGRVNDEELMEYFTHDEVIWLLNHGLVGVYLKAVTKYWYWRKTKRASLDASKS